MKTTSRRDLSFLEAIAPFAVMLMLFVAGAGFAHSGPSTIVVAMLGAAAVAGISAHRVGATWADIERAASDKLAGVLPVVLILLAIGMLIGTWMLSGTIPYLVSLGIRLVNPDYLVLTAFLATAVMSLATGTSWGSAGTIGVAMMSMAAALDAPLPAVAGAVISGAYFGDKISPLSDTTNICAISVNIDLYRHIRHLLYTTVPSFVIACVVYALVPGGASAATSQKAAALIVEIDRLYHAPLLAMLPPLVVVIAIARKRPPVLGIVASSLVAALIGILVQHFSAADAVAAAMTGFTAQMTASIGADPAALSGAFRALAERGGVYSMAPTLVVIIAAFILAGAMHVSGALNTLVRRLLAFAHSTFGLVAAAAASSFMIVALISHSGVTALLIGGLYKDAFLRRGLAPENLSRTIEDAATITEPLLPWPVSAVYMAGVVGVPTLQYAPWAVFCFTGTLGTLLLAATFDRTGFGLRRAVDEAAPADVGAADATRAISRSPL